MIEARDSRVTEDKRQDRRFLRKGISPKDFMWVLYIRFWDDAEYAADCHKCGALSVLPGLL